jgi:hypothetical protein
VLLKLATKNADHLLKNQRNDAAKYGSAAKLEEAKKIKSAGSSIASQKRIIDRYFSIR